MHFKFFSRQNRLLQILHLSLGMRIMDLVVSRLENIQQQRIQIRCLQLPCDDAWHYLVKSVELCHQPSQLMLIHT
jgi:hypothetical protein